MPSLRALPPLHAWSELGHEFNELADSSIHEESAISRAFDTLELRAGKLLATYLEHRHTPAGLAESPIDAMLREGVAQADREHGTTAQTIGSLSSPGLRIGEPLKSGKMFEAHFVALVKWMQLAFELLPSRYPDCFSVTKPSMRHPLTRFRGVPKRQREELRAQSYRERARIQATACGLLADSGAWVMPGQSCAEIDARPADAPTRTNLDGYRDTSWIREMTEGGITADMLRQARKHKRLKNSITTGPQAHVLHDVEEVGRVWSQYARDLRDAMSARKTHKNIVRQKKRRPMRADQGR